MKRLKLIAMDVEDLGVISACCQDAVGKISSFDYVPGARRFIVTLNRFVWENEGRRDVPQRRLSVLHFDRVNAVKTTGIDRSEPDKVLSLLSMTFEPGEPGDLPAGVINLVFSGDSAIQLDVDCIEVQLSDMDAAWQAKSQPRHDLES